MNELDRDVAGVERADGDMPNAIVTAAGEALAVRWQPREPLRLGGEECAVRLGALLEKLIQPRRAGRGGSRSAPPPRRHRRQPIAPCTDPVAGPRAHEDPLDVGVDVIEV